MQMTCHRVEATPKDDDYQPVEHDAFLATLTRSNVDRIRAMRRIMSGVTRCPHCDAVNPANLRLCSKCGRVLYPVEEEEEKRKFLRRGPKSGRRGRC